MDARLLADPRKFPPDLTARADYVPLQAYIPEGKKYLEQVSNGRSVRSADLQQPAFNETSEMLRQTGAQTGTVPAAASPAQLLAAGPRPTTARSKPATSRERSLGGDDVWTPERKAEADELNRIGRSYSANVAKRRATRRAISQYEKLQNKLETAAGTLHDLRALKKNYPEVYGGETPSGFTHQKNIVQHFENAERLKKELREKAQELSAQLGMKLDTNGYLSEDGLGQYTEESDKRFDNEAIDVLSDAYGRTPAQ